MTEFKDWFKKALTDAEQKIDISYEAGDESEYHYWLGFVDALAEVDAQL